MVDADLDRFLKNHFGIKNGLPPRSSIKLIGCLSNIDLLYEFIYKLNSKDIEYYLDGYTITIFSEKSIIPHLFNFSFQELEQKGICVV